MGHYRHPRHGPFSMLVVMSWRRRRRHLDFISSRYYRRYLRRNRAFVWGTPTTQRCFRAASYHLKSKRLSKKHPSFHFGPRRGIGLQPVPAIQRPDFLFDRDQPSIFRFSSNQSSSTAMPLRFHLKSLLASDKQPCFQCGQSAPAPTTQPVFRFGFQQQSSSAPTPTPRPMPFRFHPKSHSLPRKLPEFCFGPWRGFPPLFRQPNKSLLDFEDGVLPMDCIFVDQRQSNCDQPCTITTYGFFVELPGAKEETLCAN
jgi:hypothetical protein